jgi:hypothetical protein
LDRISTDANPDYTKCYKHHQKGWWVGKRKGKGLLLEVVDDNKLDVLQALQRFDVSLMVSHACGVDGKWIIFPSTTLLGLSYDNHEPLVPRVTVISE